MALLLGRRVGRLAHRGSVRTMAWWWAGPTNNDVVWNLGPIAIRTTERAIRQYVRYALYGGSGLGIFVVTTNDINRTVEANDEPMRQDQMEDLSDTIAARTAKAKWRW